MKNFKTIASFSFQSEYAVLRLLFEHNNIRFVFLNETMSSILPFYSHSFGGIRLQVHEDDIELAQEILQKFKDSSDLKIV